MELPRLQHGSATVRLLKMIKPLYKLLMRVVESNKAMTWVTIITLLVLYASSAS